MYLENSNGQQDDNDLKFIPLNIREPFRNKDSSWYPEIDTSLPTLSNISNSFIMGLSVPVDNSNLEARSFRTLDYLPRNEMNLENPMKQVLDNQFNNNQMLELQMNNAKKNLNNPNNNINNMNPASMSPGGMNPSGMNPGSMSPGSMNPSGMNPGSMSPGSMNPSGMNPGSMSPGSMNPSGMNPSSMSPGSMNPSDMNPSSMSPGSMNPNGMNPSSMSPGSMNPNGMTPGSMNQGNMNQGSMTPGSINPNNVSNMPNTNPMNLQQQQLSNDASFDLEYPSESLGEELHSYNNVDGCKSKETKRENILINNKQESIINTNDIIYGNDSLDIKGNDNLDIKEDDNLDINYEEFEIDLVHIELLRELNEETSYSSFFRGEGYNLLEEMDEIFSIISKDEDIINIFKSYNMPEPIYNLVINKIIKRTLENTTYKRGE